MRSDRITDFNDLAVAHGEQALQQSIAQQLNDPMPERQHSGGLNTPDKPAAELWKKQLQKVLKTTDRGAIQGHAYNVRQILEHDPAWSGVLAYCDFSYRILKRQLPKVAEFETGEWDDADTARLKIWLTEKYSFNPSKSEVLDALLACSQARRFHPVREYLQGLKWDGQHRIDRWLAQCLGAEAIAGPEYLAKVSRYFMISAVARVMPPLVPGRDNKVDTVLILEGKQGLKKSTAVKTLFGEWFSDAPIPIGDKDAYQNITGVWGVEMAELDSFNKAENTAAKLFFSQQVDRYRPSYGTMARNYPRQCVFVGTTNQDEYLKDYTGNRRYWPVLVKNVNIRALSDFRDQFWAEALHAYQNGERWWAEGPDELALFETEQGSRMQADPWETMLQDYLAKTTEDFITSAQLLLDCLKVDGGHMSRAHQNRLSPIMKALGWHPSVKRVTVEGTSQKVQRRGYDRPPEHDEAPF